MTLQSDKAIALFQCTPQDLIDALEIVIEKRGDMVIHLEEEDVLVCDAVKDGKMAGYKFAIRVLPLLPKDS